MKSKIFLLLIVFLASSHPLISQEYITKIESIYSSSNESVRLQHVKAALDNSGSLHIVFTGSENSTIYGTNKSGKWQFERLSYFDKDYNESIDVSYYPNIVIDNNDVLLLILFDRDKEKIFYAKKMVKDKEFKFTQVKASPEPLRFYVYGEYSDLAVDKNGGVHLICSADYTDQKEFKYNQCAVYLNKSNESEKWFLQVLIHDPKFGERNWFYGNNSSIACYGDKVYVALGGSNDLHFGTRNISGGTWDVEKLIHTPDKFINSGKDMLSLAVAKSRNVKFAFYDRTDDEESPYHGITIFSKSSCGNKKWMGFNGFEDPKAKNIPAVAFDDNGKFYIAFGQNGYSLWQQECNCKGGFKKIFGDENKTANYIDIIIDKQNVVHTFYTSEYDNKLYHLTAKPNSATEYCNYPPIINNYTGKTNVKPQEEWVGSISASDPECDNINFYTIIKHDYINIEDHGDGNATIRAKIPQGEGKGNVVFTVFTRDDKHEDIDNKVSAITFDLKISKEGNEKGSIKVENKCDGQKNFKLVK